MFVKSLADLARPYTLYVTSTASAAAIWEVATTPGTDLMAGAVFAGALLAGNGALYWGKSWELRGLGAQNADVEKVRATQASPPPDQALKPAPPPEAEQPTPERE